MTKEQRLFLTIIKDYVSGAKTEVPDAVDWNVIFDYGRSHQLTAILYAQCKDILPTEVESRFRMQYYATVAASVVRQKDLEMLLTAFENAGLKYYLVKGAAIADYYPTWQHRTMGDVDIVTADRQRADAILLQQKYKPLFQADDHEWIYKKNIEIELHNSLVYDIDVAASDEVRSFFKKANDYAENNVLDINVHLVYLFVHLRKHLMKYGVGFRQFLDIAVMAKNCNGLDWNQIEQYLKACNLLLFAQKVCEYNENWFGVPSPLQKTGIDEAFEKSTDYIFRNGVFGGQNAENKKLVATIQSQKHRFPLISMMKLALSKVFLPYKYMIWFDYCAFLRNRPILLPLAWGKRIVYTITKKGLRTGTKAIGNSFATKEEIRQRVELYQSWGLS